ncbi:hypothetical protein [Dyadobacter aurulentus]|uniref:hypothetical protein n=1 Tax=Dyadobacter sp. UC 10 TaxID=2605428 RepID=UPI0011F16C55|nr:hypothetical protein [Dyadobacter sp. UC 10]KAA0989544.1 hypothetical protein FXO21_04885 [Dyadobacter sp. UC 10]
MENRETLNDLQVSILRLFDQKLTFEEALEVRELLMNYFDQRVNKELDKVLAKKNYSTEDYRKMLIDDSFGING